MRRRSSTRTRRRSTATRRCPRHRLRWTRSAPKPTRTTCRPRPTTSTAHGTSGRRKTRTSPADWCLPGGHPPRLGPSPACRGPPWFLG
eukprot:10239965-Heterocapsa_arctica.AAC.1